MFVPLKFDHIESNLEYRCSPTPERLSPLKDLRIQVPVDNKKYKAMTPFDILKNEKPKEQRGILQKYYWELARQRAINATIKRFNFNLKYKITAQFGPVDLKECKEIIKAYLKFLEIKETRISDIDIHAERSFNIDRVVEQLDKAHFFLKSPYTEKIVRDNLNFNLNLKRNIDHV